MGHQRGGVFLAGEAGVFLCGVEVLSVVMSLQGIFAMEDTQKGGESNLIKFLMSLNSGLKEYPEFQSDHINLTDPAVLRPLLAEEFQNEECLSKALEIAKSIYEVDTRVIETDLTKPTKYGSAFAMHPEVMAEAMKKCKGKVVLEIAGASRVTSLALAVFLYLRSLQFGQGKLWEQE